MVIPEGWQEVRLGDLGTFSKGSGIKKDDVIDSGVPCIRYGQIYTEHHELVRHIQTFVSAEVASTSRPLAAGDILFAGSGETKAEIGKCVAYVDDVGAVAGGDIIVLSPSDAESRFLGYALNASWVADQKMSHAQGDAVVHISATNLASVIVPMPPRAEQRAIAGVLSDTDALVEALDALIAKKRDMKQAAMQQFFNKSLTPDNGNSLIRFGQDVSMKARIGWQGLTTAEYLARGAFRLVTGTDIQGGAINWDTCWYVDKSRYEQDKYIQLREDDVLVTKDGTIGKIGFIDSLPLPATLNSGVFVLRPVSDRIQARYLRHLMFSRVFGDFLDRLTAGSTITHLYQKDFETFTVVVPGVEEQSAIAEVLSDMDAEIDALVAQREKAELVKQGMMQELLSGRVRLA